MEFLRPADTALNKRSRSQDSITLKTLDALCGGAVDYFNLAERINSIDKDAESKQTDDSAPTAPTLPDSGPSELEGQRRSARISSGSIRF